MTKTSYKTFFATLSGDRRLDILEYLKRTGPQNVSDIAAGTGMEQSAVSHNLNKLLRCEFVHIEVRGKHRYYSLNEGTVVPLLKIVDQHIETFCNGKCLRCVRSSSLSEEQSLATDNLVLSTGRVSKK